MDPQRGIVTSPFQPRAVPPSQPRVEPGRGTILDQGVTAEDASRRRDPPRGETNELGFSQ